MENNRDNCFFAGLDIILLRINADGIITIANDIFLDHFGIKKDQAVGCKTRVLAKSKDPVLGQAIIDLEPGKNSTATAGGRDGRFFSLKATWLDNEFHVVIQDTTEKNTLQQYVSRYVGRDFSTLDESDLSTFKISERRWMSVFFADARGFTALCETMQPEEVRSLLNDFHEALIRAVDDNNATVDKIVGDEIMAFVGAPVYYADHALRSVKTALDMLDNLARVQAEYAKRRKKMPGCGIGINTGDMIVGNVGSASRQDYTVLGACVNAASRICGAAQEGQALITESTLKDLLEHPPTGWVVGSEKTADALLPETAGGKTEGVFQLPEELCGLVYEIGPAGKPVYRFRYLYGLKVKGVKDPLPVIEALSVKYLESAGFTRADLEKSILSNQREEKSRVRIFGKYRLLESLGKGGMAEVWRARDAFGNDIAVKMLLQGENAAPEEIVRFMREAEVMTRLDHPKLCRIHEFGIYDNINYIAMDLVEGVNLADMLASQKLSSSGDTTIIDLVSAVRQESGSRSRDLSGSGEKKTPSCLPEAAPGGETPQGDTASGGSAAKKTKIRTANVLAEPHALAIFEAVLEAVDYAHSLGVFHRDLKPANIIIKKSGSPVVMDFGLAKFSGEKEGLTRREQIIGTFDYMAPEQALGSEFANEKSDIFSLGAILYFMMTGQRWFESTDNIMANAREIAEKDPVRPSLLNPRIKKDLETIILKAMAREPERRYRSAQNFLADLRSYRQHEPVSARPPSLIYKLSKKARKYRAQIIAAAAVLLVSGAAICFFLGQRMKEFFTWSLVYKEDFSRTADAELKTRWNGLSYNGDYGKYELRDERPAGFGPGAAFSVVSNALCCENRAYADNLTFRQSIPGNIRVEWDVMALKNNLNFNCYLAGEDRYSGYMFHIGGWNNPRYCVLTKGKTISYLDTFFREEDFETGRWYHFRMEKEEERIRFFIDGQKIFDVEDYDELRGAGHETFGFENSFGNQQYIDNIRVYHRVLPQKISALAVADKLYERGDFEGAYREYISLFFAYRGKQIAEKALFRSGVSKIKAGNAAKGWEIFAAFEKQYPDSVLAPYALYERALVLARHKKNAEAEALYRAIGDKHKNSALSRIIFFSIVNRHSGIFSKQAEMAPDEFIAEIQNRAKIIETWSGTLGVDDRNIGFYVLAYSAFMRIGRYDLTRGKYITDWMADINGLWNRSEYLEAEKKYPDKRRDCGLSLLLAGDYERLLREYPDVPEACAEVYLLKNRAEEIIKKYPGRKGLCARACMALGRYDEIKKLYPERKADIYRAEKAAGKINNREENESSGIITVPHWGTRVKRQVLSAGGVSFAMVLIPAGSFERSAGAGKEKIMVRVFITRPFWMSENEVTQELYEAISGKNPSFLKDKDHPVSRVSWHEATNFCGLLSKKTGKKIKLPAEAQWEYACRAGTSTERFWGESVSGAADFVNFSDLNFPRPFSDTGQDDGYAFAAPVKSYLPNQWGLYDMLGNVYEWCADWYAEYGTNTEYDPRGPDTGYYRVARGGFWNWSPNSMRAASRRYTHPAYGDVEAGFRFVLPALPGE